MYGLPAVAVRGRDYLLEWLGPAVARLTKEDGARYELRRLASGRWVCSCPDFRFRGGRRPCKHLAALAGHGPDPG